METNKKCKKILRLLAYYNPEITASTHLIEDLEKACLHNGFEIDYVCPTPSRGIGKKIRKTYKKMLFEKKCQGAVRVHRFKLLSEHKNVFLRACRYLLSNIKQYNLAKRIKNIDIILAGSTPPTQGLVAAFLKKKLKKPMVYILQDIFPDSLISTGIIQKKSLIYQIGRVIENYTYKYADKIIVVNQTFYENLL